MEQNTQYLYEYQNGKRVRNIGFMKIEQQMDRSMIHIYAKQMDEVKGIMFEKENGERYIATWEEQSITLPTQPDVPQQPAMPQSPITPQQPTVPQIPSTPPIVEEMEPEASLETEEVEEYIQPRNTVYEKIQRQDLSRLPRKEWRLANNSFLLHGVYNYHHLLYIEEDGEKWIGVPGIYHEKEKMAANAFGFTEFRRLVDVNIDLQENERNTYEDFGYWCRQVAIS